MALFGFIFALHRFTPVPAWKAFVDIGAESNLPTWWNTTLLLLVAVWALTAAILAEARVRRAWLLVATAAAYLSLDEAASLHEWLLGGLLKGDLPTYSWVIPGAVLAVAGSAMLIVAGRYLPTQTAKRLGLALIAYGVGAVGLEAIGGWLVEREYETLFTFAITLEESLEMLAAAYATGTIVDSIDVSWSGGRLELTVPSNSD